MSESGLITDYISALSADLPAGIVEELADGLDQTRTHFLKEGREPDAAARAAIAEFGEPRVISAAFTLACPARRTARRLLAAGPLVGACWGAALVTDRAWTWPVPAAARILLAVALITVIGVLAVAALGTRYRPVRRAGTAGCVAIVALDCTMLIAVTLAIPALAWPVIMAMAASGARITFAARMILRPILASGH